MQKCPADPDRRHFVNSPHFLEKRSTHSLTLQREFRPAPFARRLSVRSQIQAEGFFFQFVRRTVRLGLDCQRTLRLENAPNLRTYQATIFLSACIYTYNKTSSQCFRFNIASTMKSACSLCNVSDTSAQVSTDFEHIRTCRRFLESEHILFVRRVE